MGKLNLNKGIVNVTLIFYLAYFIVHLLYISFIHFCASFIGVKDIKSYFSYVAYDLTDFDGWTKWKVFILFGIPTLLLPVIAGMFWVIKKKFSFENNPKIKLFYLNIVLITIAFLIADFIIAPFRRQGVALVAEWFYFKKEVVFGVSLIFWALIPIVAWLFSKSYMKLANSRIHLRSKWTRVLFLIVNVLQPFVLSAIHLSIMIIMVPSYTMNHYFSIDFIRFAIIFILLLFIVLFNFNKKYLGIKKSKNLEKIEISFVIFTIGVSAALYFVLLF